MILSLLGAPIKAVLGISTVPFCLLTGTALALAKLSAGSPTVIRAMG